MLLHIFCPLLLAHMCAAAAVAGSLSSASPPSKTDRCLVICVKGDPPLNGIVSVTPQEEAAIRAEASQPAAVPCNCCPGTSGGHSRQRDAARVPGRGGGFTPQTHKTVQSCPATPYWAYCLITDGWHIDRQQRVDVAWKCENPGTYGSPIVALNGCFWGAVKQVSLTLCNKCIKTVRYWPAYTSILVVFSPAEIVFHILYINNCYSLYSH